MFRKLILSESLSSQNEMTLLTRCALALVISILTIGLSAALILSPKAEPVLAIEALDKLALSGVENPVTAVLLNFRSYDTLLEIAVLLIVAVTMSTPSNKQMNQSAADTSRWLSVNDAQFVHPILTALLRWLIPLGILLSGYLLWTGAYLPGGAFQAGAVLTGVGVALAVAGRHHFTWHLFIARFVLTVGLIAFVAMAAGNALATGIVLQYPIEHAGLIILLVELAATISIAAILLMLFTQITALPNTSERLKP